MKNIIQTLEDKLFKKKNMSEETTQQPIMVTEEVPAETPAEPTAETPAPEAPTEPTAPVEPAPVEANTPDVEPEPETPAEPVDPEDRSAFNCTECGGEGLKDQYTLCPNCKGTGKV